MRPTAGHNRDEVLFKKEWFDGVERIGTERTERIGFDLVAIEMLLAGGVILLAATAAFVVGISG